MFFKSIGIAAVLGAGLVLWHTARLCDPAAFPCGLPENNPEPARDDNAPPVEAVSEWTEARAFANLHEEISVIRTKLHRLAYSNSRRA